MRRDDRGQAGRDRGDREADADQEQVVEVVAADQPEDDDERQRGRGHDRDQHRQLVELARERRLLLLDAGQHPRDLADLGRHSGRRHHHLAAPARDGRVHVRHVDAVAERDVVAGDRVDRLQHRRALAGERRPPRSPASRRRAAARRPGPCRRPRRSTMSPGTSSSAGMSTRSPSRRTCAWIRSIFWSAATLSAALPSWLRPRTAFSTVRPMITRPVDTPAARRC